LRADPAQVKVVVERGKGSSAQRVELLCKDVYDGQAGRNRLGISIMADYTQRRTLSFGEAFASSWQFMFHFIKVILGELGRLVTKPSAIGESMAGPIGVITQIGEAVRTGLEGSLLMMMLISVNVGVFNLLPFPGLDGSRLVFTSFEMITKKRVPSNVEAVIHMVGLVLLMLLVVYLTFGDITRLFTGRPLGGG